jgi:hypothetical protein
MAHNAATKDLHISKTYTTVRLIGGIDCVPNHMIGCPFPDLDVRGGVRIGKSLCIEGNIMVDQNVIIDGDLTVKGNTYITTTEHLIIRDKTLCLANVAGNVLASNVTANGGGIIVKGPLPDESKSIIWYLDGPWWHFNQDINLGRGRMSNSPHCSADDGLSGHAYRIFDQNVLDYTTLGLSVTNSSL